MAGDRRLTFTDQELTEAFKQALREEGYGEAPAAWANALRKDVERNSGIVQGNPRQGFFFLHLTVHEFLAASALANIVNKDGWETPIQSTGNPVSIARLMDRKAWEPAWQEVFSFLAGKLTEPLPLLSLLIDTNRDDLFRHRLALAAACLPEALSKLGQQPSVADRITGELLAMWMQHDQKETLPAVSHFTRTLPALGQVNGKVAGIPLLEWCCQQLCELNPALRAAAVELVGLIGETVARRPIVLTLLTEILRDSRTDVVARAKTVTALRRIGPATLQHYPDLLATLEQVALHEVNWFVRTEAIRTIEQIGGQITGGPAREGGFGVPPFVKGGIGGISPRGSTPLMIQEHVSFSQDDLPTLAQALANKDLQTRAQALSTLERLRAPAAQGPEAVSALIQVALHDKNGGMRSQATRVLSQLGQAVVDHPSGLHALVQIVVRDKDVGVRAQALHALGEIGDLTTRYPEVIPTLLSALQDKDGDVRFSAAEALEKMMAQGVRIFQRKWKGIGWKRLEVKRVDELTVL
jgi:HEAT repeat protein